jgi:hypothetical protein
MFMILPRHCHPYARIFLGGSRCRRRRAVPTATLSSVQRYFADDPLSGGTKDVFERPSQLQFEIPQRHREKVVCLEDAVSLIRDGDTISVSGFVAQGILLYIL